MSAWIGYSLGHTSGMVLVCDETRCCTCVRADVKASLCLEHDFLVVSVVGGFFCSPSSKHLQGRVSSSLLTLQVFRLLVVFV